MTAATITRRACCLCSAPSRRPGVAPSTVPARRTGVATNTVPALNTGAGHRTVLARSTVFAVAMLTGAFPAFAQNTDAADRGNAKFQHSCAPCHGRGPGDDGRAMLPGTDALRIKYSGALPPALEDRSDLPAEVLSTYLRKGSFSMPPFRKTELSDAEIGEIALYLAQSSAAQ